MTDALALLTRRADLAPASANRDDRTVEVIWSTGAPVRITTPCICAAFANAWVIPPMPPLTKAQRLNSPSNSPDAWCP